METKEIDIIKVDFKDIARTIEDYAKLDYRVNVTLQEEWTEAGNHKMYYEVRVLKVMLDN